MEPSGSEQNTIRRYIHRLIDLSGFE
jgi:hypothetical protein